MLRRLSRLCLLAPSARHLIRAVRHRMATGRGCLPRSMAIIGAACYPLARPIRFPCRSTVLPFHRSHRLPPRSLDTGDGAGVLGFGGLPLLFDFTCDLFVLVLCIAAAVVVLLAWVSYYVCCRWGDAVARRFVSGL